VGHTAGRVVKVVMADVAAPVEHAVVALPMAAKIDQCIK
jgi:hypothetical protein